MPPVAVPITPQRNGAVGAGIEDGPCRQRRGRRRPWRRLGETGRGIAAAAQRGAGLAPLHTQLPLRPADAPAPGLGYRAPGRPRAEGDEPRKAALLRRLRAYRFRVSRNTVQRVRDRRPPARFLTVAGSTKACMLGITHGRRPSDCSAWPLSFRCRGKNAQLQLNQMSQRSDQCRNLVRVLPSIGASS